MTTTTRIVLCMIVKNEAAIIGRCLDAALPLVDGYVICDTGSTDGTRDAALAAVTRHGKPGRIDAHVWVNFGVTRTGASMSARQFAADQAWSATTTYLLFLDADHVLKADGFDLAQLTGPHYHLAQVEGGLRYYNTRLARLDHEWRCIGVTHEYWSPQPDAKPERLETLWLDDRGDGGSKGDKTERDIRMLTEGLQAEPENVRYQFYLAQALFYSGRFAEAADWYAKRMRGGGYEEEAWFAAMRYGEAKLKDGAHAEGAAALLDAWERRPHRAEPLVALATHYRHKGKNHLALMLAERAAQIPYPHSDALFVDEPSHRSRPLEEIAITAYYCGKPARGMTAADTLLAQRGHPSSFYDSIARNQTFYLRNPPVKRSGRFPIPEGLDAKYGMPYWGTNPTIVQHGFHYLAHVRLVNYKQTNGRHYDAAGGVFRTRGAVLAWNPKDGALTQPWEVDLVMPEGWNETRINGLEDVRWVRHEGRVWFTATCCQVPGSGGWPRVVLGLMTPDLCGVERVTRLDYGQQGEGAREKNWVPWSRRGGLFLIYSYDPFVVLRVDPETGSWMEEQRWTPPFNASRWKGSTTPVPWEDGHWLMLVHETAYMLGSDGQWAYSVYAHRFVEIADDTLTVTRYSRPFTWERQGTAGACIEYAAGLARHHDDLIVTYGVEDREAAWVEIASETVASMLVVVPS
jgi:tetratricopeptide (TPR) repeat protein